VVIAILGMLIGLLVPAVGAAWEVSKDIQCKNNLHHLHTALKTGKTANFPNVRGWVTHCIAAGAGEMLQCPADEIPPDARPAGASTSVSEPVAVEELHDPPSSVVFNSLESNTHAWIFTEQENISLPTSVPVDLSTPGYYENRNSSPSVIPAGTICDIYFIHFDPVGSQSATITGRVSFDGEILGITCHSGTLDQSDGLVGREGVSYPTGQGARGFEGVEKVEISEDRHSYIIHHYHSTFPGEQVRIFTIAAGSRESCSYGMNNQVTGDETRPGQLLLLEYTKSIVDVDRVRRDDDYHEFVAPRHGETRLNAVFVDGSVKAVEVDEVDPEVNYEVWPASR
jgi:prepilin-type processing-associated H-X9-DG protein